MIITEMLKEFVAASQEQICVSENITTCIHLHRIERDIMC